MLFTQAALTLAALAASTLAADEFYLKTIGSNISSHNGLYLESYHTGAGQADAVLATATTNAGHFFFNDTELLMDVGDPDYTYGFEIDADIEYAAWQFVFINVQSAEAGFSLTDDNILTWNGTEFGGWLACDWWYGVPQLFWIIEYDSIQYPSTCSAVNLTSEAISS